MATINGTEGDDLRNGTAGADTINGFGGNDTLNGLGGADVIDGGSGDDLLNGGTENDTLFGGAGSDTLIGGVGNDSLNPGDSFDFDDIRPGSGNDTINLSGQTTGFAFLYYGDFDDYYGAGATGIVANLSGGGAADTIVKFGGTHTDTIIGLDSALYNDRGFGLYGTDRNDTFNLTNMNGDNPFGAYFEITPGGGVDSYVVNGAAWGRINFDEGAFFNPAPQGLVINLVTGVISNDGFGNAETITYQNGGYIQRVRATNNNDSVVGTSNSEVFDLLGGNDTLNAGDGFDRLRYDQFDVTGLVVNTQIGTATGTIDYRGAITAFTHNFSNVEYIDGSRNDDQINGSGVGEQLRGRSGNDTINGFGGNDTILGDDGGDWLDGGAGNDYINPGSDSGNFEEDVILGSAGNDTIDYSSVFSNFQTLAYANIGNGITFSFDRDTNTATVNKGASGTDTIIDLINPLDNGDGFQVYGTEFADTFVIDNLESFFLLEVRGGRGLDSYTLAPGLQEALLDLSGDEEGGPTTQGAVVNLTLATGQIVNDGFGNTETISGGSFARIEGTAFNDSFTGGAGDDWFMTFGGNNTINGGAGFDEMRYAGFGFISVNANLATGTASFSIDQGSGPQAFTDTLTSIEALDGTRSGNDTIIGSSGDNALRGRGGNDSLVGGAGDDTLRGDEGNDTLRGGDGNDNLRGGDGNDLLDASQGSAATQGFGDFVEPGRGTNSIFGHQALWNEGEGIDIFYLDVTGSGGLSFVINANGFGSVQSAIFGVVNDSFSYTHYFHGTNDADSFTRAANEDRWFGFRGGAGNDTFTGNSNGTDYVDYWDDSEYEGAGAVTVNLQTGVATDGFGDTDTLIDIEEVRGSGFDDSLTGNGDNNRLEGMSGNDTINGGDGSDTLIGGAGNDSINGGGGDDFILPGSGVDTINGGTGVDTLAYIDAEANAGIQVSVFSGSTVTVGQAIDWGGATDTFTDIERFIGTAFNDTMSAAVAVTAGLTFFGEGGNDSITGGSGNDTLEGGDGNDTLNGGAGNDVIYHGAGNDSMNGGDGNDTFQGGNGRDTFIGGAGTDIYIDDVSAEPDPTVFDLVFDLVAGLRGASTQAPADRDTISQIENYTLIGAFDALVTGNDVANVFTLGSGRDTVSAGGGADVVFAGQGNDSIDGGFGGDTLRGQEGDDTINGGFGLDLIFGGSGNDLITAGADQDTLYGDSGADTLDGGENSDRYFLGDAFDTLNDTGTTGYDEAFITSTTGLVINVSGWTGIERINGFSGNDTLSAATATTSWVLSGEGGNDSLTGSVQDDTLLGGAGDDFLSGGDGIDQMLGGTGNDTFVGGAGDDSFFIGESGDIVQDGGAGFDRAVINNPAGVSIAMGTWLGVERVNGFTGNDSIDATGYATDLIFDGRTGNDTLIGGSANDTFYAGDGADSVFGGAGNDALIGDAGNDTLNGGTGDDFLLGLSGADVFVFDDAWGNDVVRDFAVGLDKLNFALHSGVNALSDLVIEQVGANTRILLVTPGADVLTLADVDAVDLGASDFQFV
jgi:Ca2+-binding RTX toxin-like protein